MLGKHDICGSVYSDHARLRALGNMLASAGVEYQINEAGERLDYAFPAQDAPDPSFIVDKWRQCA